MAKRADFVFTKNWGSIKKGTKMENMDRARARSLQDVRKVGKIQKPKEDKSDPDVNKRSVK